jgi:hypothetical protein
VTTPTALAAALVVTRAEGDDNNLMLTALEGGDKHPRGDRARGWRQNIPTGYGANTCGDRVDGDKHLR